MRQQRHQRFLNSQKLVCYCSQLFPNSVFNKCLILLPIVFLTVINSSDFAFLVCNLYKLGQIPTKNISRRTNQTTVPTTATFSAEPFDTKKERGDIRLSQRLRLFGFLRDLVCVHDYFASDFSRFCFSRRN